MKPDKHKQKRTQQYKKKHGVKDEKNSDKPDSHSASASTSDSHSHSHTHSAQSRREDRPSASIAEETGNDGALRGSDNTPEVVLQSRTSFKRREVVSNWERYAGIHDEPEEIHTECRGADFKTLLGSTSSAASQFRLADEQLLDEEVSSGGASDLHGFLTIDTHELAAALDCVPLHKKLNIEDAVFRKEDIDLFEQVAVDNLKLYLEARNNPKITKQIPSNTDSVHQIWNNEQDILDVTDEEAVSKHAEVSGVDSDRKSNTKISEQKGCEFDVQIEDDLNELLGSRVHTYQNDMGHDTDGRTAEPSNSAGIQTAQDVFSSNEEVNSEEGAQNPPELNNGEVSDSTSPRTCVIGSKANEHERLKYPAPTVKSLEDDLDKLLSLDRDGTTSSNMTKSSVLNKSSADNENDLEDWLDTILDD